MSKGYFQSEEYKRRKRERKEVSERSKRHKKDLSLLKRLNGSTKTFAQDNFINTKDSINEKCDEFIMKYLDPNSEFQKRVAVARTKPDFLNSIEYKCNELVNDLINKGIRNLTIYASINDPLFFTDRNIDKKKEGYVKAKKILKEEKESLKNARAEFVKYENTFNELYKDKASYGSFFKELYNDFNDLVKTTNGIVNGKLEVPEKGTEGTEHLDMSKEANGGKSIKPSVLDKHKKQVRWAKVSEPLFSHEPTAEDCLQGKIGDCYFVAAMMSIVATDPDKIKEAIIDNGDTCTVRFFEGGMPLYVTVDKTVPIDVETGEPIYGKGSLWFMIMEKAYVQSGILGTKIEDLIEDPRSVETEYNDIVAGKAFDVLTDFLGGQVKESGEVMNINGPWKKVEDDDGETYSKDEIEFFEKIKKGCKIGVVTAGSLHNDANLDNQYEDSKGIPYNHAYSVIDTEEHDGKKYIRVRNPHVRGGRIYDKNGKPQYEPNPKVPGESLIELNDFLRTFQSASVATYNSLPIKRLNERLVNDYKYMYKDALIKICKKVANSDKFYHLFNSDSFNQFRKKSDALLGLMTSKKEVDFKKLDKAMKDFFATAKAYKTERDNRPIELAHDERETSCNRYAMAEVVSEMEKIFVENSDSNEMSYVDFDDLMSKALAYDSNASRAKKAMQADFEKREEVDHGLEEVSIDFAENVDDRIADIENRGIHRVEDAFSRGKTEKFKLGIVEVMVTNAIKENRRNMTESQIKRQLSDKELNRAKDLLGKKIESALKDITKVELKEYLKSENPGKEIASRVINEINGHEVERRVEEPQLQNNILQ